MHAILVCARRWYPRPVSYALLLLPEFSLILLGYLICRYTALNRSVWSQVDTLVYYLLFPALLFHSIIKSPLDLGEASRLLAGGLGVLASGVVLAYSLPYLPGLRQHIGRRDHAAAAQVGFRFNSFIGLALAERLGGATGLLSIAVLIGFCVPLANVAAVWPMARGSERGFGRELLRNPLIIATTSGLAANLLGLSLPPWLEPTVARIGAASLALGLMAAGAGMQLQSLARAKVLGTALLGIRHLLLPLVALGLAFALKLSPVHATILLTFAAVPTAASGYVLAAKMGYDGGFVGALVTASTLLGMVSLGLSLGILLPLYRA
jgi:malonate transporter